MSFHRKVCQVFFFLFFFNSSKLSRASTVIKHYNTSFVLVLEEKNQSERSI